MEASYLFTLESQFVGFVIMDLIIAVFLVVCLKFLAGMVANVCSTHELATRDNYAFGIELAGGIFALGIMLTGILSGDFSENLTQESVLVLGYGILGIGLIKVGRIMQDALVLPDLDIRNQIKRGNLAAAIVDVGNVVGTAIIIRGVMLWVESNEWMGAVVVVVGFLISQIILSLVARLRSHVFAKRNNGANLQDAFSDGNRALAVRYFGHVIGVALAVTTSAYFVSFSKEAIGTSLIVWTLFSLFMFMLLSLLARIARKIILSGIDVSEEVDHQENIGVACIEAMIFITIGLILAAVMA